MPRAEFGAYCLVDSNKELRQSEIISDITYYSIETNKEDSTKVDTTSGKLSYAIIVTPDCDLLQDFKSKNDGKKAALLNVLLFSMEEANQARQRIGYSSNEWKHVKQNVVERVYFLNAIAPDDDLLKLGIPDSVIDFKRYCTLPSDEILRQCQLREPNKANRRCRLSDLWREDLQRRAMAYMQRIGLPDPSDAP